MRPPMKGINMNSIDYTADTISKAAGLNENQANLVRLGVIVVAGFILGRVIRRVVTGR